jgi:purine-binding chemotaxis protein CheW
MSLYVDAKSLEKNMTSLLENTAARRNLVTFRLGRQIYALPVERIVQIIPMGTITPTLQDDQTVGVIEIRGATVPVVNLRPHLGLRKTALQLHTPILLVQNSQGTIGLIVDKVIDILSVPADEIADFADLLSRGLREAPILQGMAYIQNSTVLLLNLDHLRLSH